MEKDILISLPDGNADAVLFQPATEGHFPGILYLTDIGGIRPAQRQAAQRLSNEGYTILMPNVFYRTSKPPVMDLAALRPNPELFMQRVRELAAPLTPEAQERDAKAYVDYLTNLAPGKLGAVGFCICGAVALQVAATCPDQVAAAASFHGGNLLDNLSLDKIKARLLFGHAENDRSMPAESIAILEEKLKTWGGQYESETYPGSLHGWTTLDNPVYNQPQAERAYQKLTDLFASQVRLVSVS